MKMSSSVRCCGIKESAGSFEGRAYSSTKFHLVADIAESQSGESMGFETRPFTFGDASEFAKWKHLKSAWPDTGIMVDVVFDVVTASDSKTKLVLLDIKPAKAVNPAPRA